MREGDIQSMIRLKLNDIENGRYWRANAGQAWTGNDITRRGKTVIIRDARPFKSGLPKGFPDIFGVTPLLITENHVGQILGIFTGIEVKNKSKVTEAQRKMVVRLLKSGSMAGVAYCVEDAIKITSSLNGD